MTPVRHREMRYRVMLRLMMARLQSTFSDGLFPYDSADELAGDLRLIIDSLAGTAVSTPACSPCAACCGGWRPSAFIS